MSRKTQPDITEAVAQPPLIEALCKPECYDHEVEAVEILETHISWIVLTGRFAYKIKKPIKLSFVDFSTLELRRRYCEEELRLNRRLAAALYLAVVPIGGSVDAPRMGREPAFEYAVKMRQFDAEARLDFQLAQGKVDLAAILGLAERIAAFHMSLPPAGDRAPKPQRQIENILTNQAEIESFVGDPRFESALSALRAFVEQECRRLRPLIEARSKTAAYKECHGDLHLENLVRLDGEIVPFDALEFNPSLRCIDVVSEIAFLAMDLMARGADELAYRYLNRYLEIDGDYEGLALLRLYLVYRASVRAKVRAIKESQSGPSPGPEPDMSRYLGLAARLARRRRPLLLITHGLSGSGKTYLSDRLIGPLHAIRIRSDLERKRRHGLAAEQASGSGVGTGLYSGDETRETYRRLAECARFGIDNGVNVIVDAAFPLREQRAALRRMADTAGARFRILHCRAPVETLRQRIAARAVTGHDASEATGAVLDFQLERFEPLDAEEAALSLNVDTTSAGDFQASLEALSALVDWQAD